MIIPDNFELRIHVNKDDMVEFVFYRPNEEGATEEIITELKNGEFTVEPITADMDIENPTFTMNKKQTKDLIINLLRQLILE